MARQKAVPVVEVLPDATVVAEALESKPDRDPCLCGCGGYPKGAKARFIPGHDARYHAAQKKAQAL